MDRINQVSLISFVISGSCLALGFYLVGFWLVSIAIIVCRLFCWIGGGLRIKWLPTFVFVFDFIFLIAGVILAAPSILLVMGLVGSLITWDLEGYRYRLKNIPFYSKEITHTRKYIMRLFITAASGGVLAIFSITIHIQPRFGVIVLFSVLAVLGLSIGIQIAQRSM
jgi:hypothetical protein